MLISKPSKKRYDAFWNQSAYERCCLYLTHKRDSAPPPHGSDFTEKWEDFAYRLWLTQRNIASTTYYADAFPVAHTDFSSGSLAACVGGSYRLRTVSVCYENEPVIADINNPPDLSLRKDSKMYAMLDELTSLYLEDGKGKYLTHIHDIGGTYDILAALRGTQDILIDMLDNPEAVKECVKRLQPAWRDMFLLYAQRLITAQGGMTSWMPIYSEKPYYPLQCDFSVMISPDMFAEFIVPDLTYQTGYMDRSVYHLDGPEQIQHLPHLLAIPRLTAVQWIPGVREVSSTHEKWYEMYERIQRAGKGLVILGCKDADGFENLLKHISTKGLFVSFAAKDDYEAKHVLEVAEKYGVK